MVKESALQVTKATLASVVFSLVYVLVFTLIIKLTSISNGVITPVNQAFKIICIALGGILFIRGEKGFIKGAIYGLCSVVACYVLFAIIGGSFAVKWTFVFEILLGVVAGLISGIIAVNIKKS
ncbi:MAG: TIGR04086 family membrane protein [Candidatus Coproplasma sp.]